MTQLFVSGFRLYKNEVAKGRLAKNVGGTRFMLYVCFMYALSMEYLWSIYGVSMVGWSNG